jgi:hypothetical protein
MRLLSNGVEVQKPDGSLIRFIENDPRRPQEYEEFRPMALHLAWLSANRQLFVRSLVFEETLIADFKEVPRAEDIVNGFNHEGSEFPVEKDPRTGPIQDNPPVTLQINVTDTQPPNPVPSVKYGGKHYSVGDTPWDRTTFVILLFLFQTAVGDVEDVGIPITISK